MTFVHPFNFVNLKSIFLILFTVSTGQIQVGEWKSYTSYITPTTVNWTSPTEVYASTRGGILKYTRSSDQFEFFNTDDGLDYSDITGLSSKDGIFYLGGSTPKGSIQTYSPSTGLLKNIDHLELDEIGKMVIDENKLYAVYYSGMTSGLMELSITESDNPHFEDIYHEFPVEVNQITDIDTDSNFIYLTTDSAVLRGEKTSILNFQSSWEILYEENVPNQLVLANGEMYVFSDAGIEKFEDDHWVLLVSMNAGTILDAHPESEGTVSFVTHTLYREFSTVSETVSYSIEMPASTKITCYDKNNDLVVLGMKRRGLMFLDRISGELTSKVPNTMVSNHFHSIDVGPNGELIAHINDPSEIENTDRLSGVMILNDGVFTHVLTELNTDGMYLNDANPHNFTAIRRDWMSGGIGSGGIKWSSDDKIIIGVSGVFPSDPDHNGGIIILDPVTMEHTIIDTADGILDGMNGIVDNNSASGYMSIHDLKNDSNGNLWVVNAYSETYNHPLAIRTPAGDWSHVTAPDSESFLPQSVTFDSRNQAWVGFRDYYEYSSGGIKVVNTRSTLSDESDDIWYDTTFSDPPPGTSVWDLTFDNLGLLWILTSGGVQGYQVFDHANYIQLVPVYPIDYFGYIPFRKGDKIISDELNNKWITSQSDGVRVITESTVVWPDEYGFTTENSPLLSNIVYDMAIDNENGMIYFATDKGISSLKLFYDESINSTKTKLGVSPNPFYPGNGETLIINGCPPGANVLVMSLSGRVISELKANYEGMSSTQAVWDGRLKSGEFAGSGIYLITAYIDNGTTATTKVAIIRR